MDRILEIYTRPASPEETRAILAVIDTQYITAVCPEWTPQTGGLGLASHWTTWKPLGKRAILYQVREKKEPTPRTYFILPDRILRVCGEAGLVISANVVILGGVLAMRKTTTDPASYERERVRTLASLTTKTGASDDPDQEIVFLVRECFFCSGARGEPEDFQTRMVVARSLVEGEAGRPKTSIFTSQGCVRICYQPHMAPSQVQVLTRDVPPPIVGTTLVGVELHPADEKTHKSLTVTGNYVEAIRVLTVGNT